MIFFVRVKGKTRMFGFVQFMIWKDGKYNIRRRRDVYVLEKKADD